MTARVFETPRLFARRLGADDVDALHAVYGDDEAMRWVGDGQALSREGCAAWVGVTQRNYATRGYGMFALLERAAPAEVVGFAGLVHPGGQEAAEIKYALRRSHWGRGLASEAAAALLSHGARVHGLRRIIATVDPENLASQRVLLKAGMQLGELRRDADGALTQYFVWLAPGAGTARAAGQSPGAGSMGP